MANKQWLDSEGLRLLAEYIKALHDDQQTAIDLLNSSSETPGSISKMINDAIAELDIANLQHGETLYIYGGSASDVLPEVGE